MRGASEGAGGGFWWQMLFENLVSVCGRALKSPVGPTDGWNSATTGKQWSPQRGTLLRSRNSLSCHFNLTANELGGGARDSQGRSEDELCGFWGVFLCVFFLFCSPNIWDLTHTLKRLMLRKMRLTRWSKSGVGF